MIDGDCLEANCTLAQRCAGLESAAVPVQQRLGPSKCMCNQTQRARLHPGDHFVFETSQIMDIPYGQSLATTGFALQ